MLVQMPGGRAQRMPVRRFQRRATVVGATATVATLVTLGLVLAVGQLGGGEVIAMKRPSVVRQFWRIKGPKKRGRERYLKEEQAWNSYKNRQEVPEEDDLYERIFKLDYRGLSKEKLKMQKEIIEELKELYANQDEEGLRAQIKRGKREQFEWRMRDFQKLDNNRNEDKFAGWVRAEKAKWALQALEQMHGKPEEAPEDGELPVQDHDQPKNYIDTEEGGWSMEEAFEMKNCFHRKPGWKWTFRKKDPYRMCARKPLATRGHTRTWMTLKQNEQLKKEYPQFADSGLFDIPINKLGGRMWFRKEQAMQAKAKKEGWNITEARRHFFDHTTYAGIKPRPKPWDDDYDGRAWKKPKHYYRAKTPRIVIFEGVEGEETDESILPEYMYGNRPSKVKNRLPARPLHMTKQRKLRVAMWKKEMRKRAGQSGSRDED